MGNTTIKIDKINVSLIVLIFALIILTPIVASAILTKTVVLTSNANVGAIGVAIYSDSSLSTPLININWGNLSAGDVSTFTMYVSNAGNQREILTIASGNWNPVVAGTFITITWDKQNTYLQGGQNVAAIVTLTVSPDITGVNSFSNTITITGTKG